MEDKNRNKEKEQQIKNSNRYIDINPTISIITLSASGLNMAIKRQIVRVDQKTRLSCMLSTRNTLNI